MKTFFPHLKLKKGFVYVQGPHFQYMWELRMLKNPNDLVP